jgi:hypothetical protein
VEATWEQPSNLSLTKDESLQNKKSGSTSLALMDGQQPAPEDSMLAWSSFDSGDICELVQDDLWDEPVPTANSPKPHELVWLYPERYPLLNKDRRKAPLLALVAHLIRVSWWRIKYRRY